MAMFQMHVRGVVADLCGLPATTKVQVLLDPRDKSSSDAADLIHKAVVVEVRHAYLHACIRHSYSHGREG